MPNRCVICSNDNRDLERARVRLGEENSLLLTPKWETIYQKGIEDYFSSLIKQAQKSPNLLVIAAVHDQSSYLLLRSLVNPPKHINFELFYVSADSAQLDVARREKVPHGNYTALEKFVKDNFPPQLI